jgi:hypothetical protein
LIYNAYPDRVVRGQGFQIPDAVFAMRGIKETCRRLENLGGKLTDIAVLIEWVSFNNMIKIGSRMFHTKLRRQTGSNCTRN